MSFEPDLANGVYRVQHILQTATAHLTVVNDLIFIDGRPLVVLEWTPPDGRHPPVVTVSLDHVHLTAMPGPPGHFLYDLPVLDPRTRH